ncbi:MAG: Transrane protein [Chlorobi bacterium]|nr:Transrane protein [Chlorobiota bacterium]
MFRFPMITMKSIARRCTGHPLAPRGIAVAVNVLFAVALLLRGITLSAQPVSSDAGRPIGQLLKPDGTFNTSLGYDGAVDTRGWRMETDLSGVPHFYPIASGGGDSYSLASVPGDEYWDDGFGNFHMDGDVYAIAANGEDVFIGGGFDELDKQTAHRVARWNGSSWLPLGDGVNGNVNALAVVGDNLYVGGQFTLAGGIGASNIAVWSLTAGRWLPLGSGLAADGYSYVSAITVNGTDLYVGGSFTTAGGITANNIARFSMVTNSWAALPGTEGNGTDGDVMAIAIKNTNVYVGGAFRSVAGDPASNLARWDMTTRAWSAIGAGVRGYVNAIGVGPQRIYIGGRFDRIGSDAAANIGYYIEATGALTTLAYPGGTSSAEGNVHAITVYRDFIFASGAFRVISPGLTGGRTVANYVGYWDRDTVGWGSVWSPVWHQLDFNEHSGTDGYIDAMFMSGTSLYVGGSYRVAGGAIRGRIARYDLPRLFNNIQNHVDRGEWNALGVKVTGPVHAIATRPGETLIAGVYKRPNGQDASTILKWDGVRLTQIKRGIKGTINAMALDGDDLYFGGQFFTLDSMPAVNIARLRLSSGQISALDSGLLHNYRPTDSAHASVASIAIHGDDLYAGGVFDQAGAARIAVNNVAHWSIGAGTWSAMDRGVYGNINAVAVTPSGTVYIGGHFSAPDTSVRYLARWDGDHWGRLGNGGINDDVVSLLADGERLYVGGDFKTIGRDTVGHIAQWDGTRWNRLGDGLGGFSFPMINSLAMSGSTLYAGGFFTVAGADSASNIARWDGSRWHPMGSGADNQIFAIAVGDGGLYAGGRFVEAGAKTSIYFGRWLAPELDVRTDLPHAAAGGLAGSPNPFTGTTSIDFTLARAGQADLRIYDMRGREVAKLLSATMERGDHRAEWNGDGYPAGVYYCRLRTADGTRATMLLLER